MRWTVGSSACARLPPCARPHAAASWRAIFTRAGASGAAGGNAWPAPRVRRTVRPCADQDDGVRHAVAALQQVAQLALGAGVSDAGWKSGSRWTPRWLPPRMAASVVPAPRGTLAGSSRSRSIRRWPSVIDHLNMARHARGNDCRKSSTTLCSSGVSITIRGVSARIGVARSCKPLICENRVKTAPSIAERGVVRRPGSCRLSRDLARRCTLAVRF